MLRVKKRFCLNISFLGDETIGGIDAEKWGLTQTIGQKINRYTVWLYYKDDLGNEDTKVTIPLRYEMKGFNSLLGSHYDHYYLEYNDFDADPIPADIFKVGSKYIVNFLYSNYAGLLV